MGFDFASESGEEFWINTTDWRHLLTFAEAHGFRWPVKEDGEEYQSLTANDAGLLANVIERGLGDESSTALVSKISEELSRLLVTPSDSPLFRGDPIEVTERSLDYWREFASFARKGGFTLCF
jgi:hypothetical protein